MAQSQTTIYSENFNAGFGGWTNTNLTTPWGNTTDILDYENIWQNDDGESGMNPNVCGAAGQSNPTLFIGSPMAGGAAYSSGATTNRRISSPNIASTGYANMTLQFNFIGNGCETRDRAYFQYSIDGGTNWISPTAAPASSNPAMGTGGNMGNLKSSLCSGGQGRWTQITWEMPTACENITDLKIAFVWQNSDGATCSGTPTDPSFAVDDIIITIPKPVSIELFFFNGDEVNGTVHLEWATLSETNNDYFTVERSSDGYTFSDIVQIGGAGNSNEPLYYSYTDKNAPPGILYYRLKQTDFDGQQSYSKILVLNINGLPEIRVFPVPADDFLFIELSELEGQEMQIELIDLLGKSHINQSIHISYESETIPVNVSTVPSGLYLLRIITKSHISTHKIKIN